MIRLRIAPGSPKVVVRVKLHRRSHLSDILAKFMLERYGHLKYGIGAVLDLPTIVMVGRGGYDEHDPALMPDPDAVECEATLVAKDLGIADWPRLQPILQHTLAVDAKGEEKSWKRLGRLVEQMHDVYPRQPWRVEQWAYRVIEASIEAGPAGAVGGVDRARALAIIPEAYAAIRSEFQPRARAAMDPHIEELGRAGEAKPFDFFHCVHLITLKFRRLPGAPATEWAKDALRAVLWQQELFFRARDGFQRAYQSALEERIEIRGQEMFVLVIRSDLQRLHSYINSECDRYAAIAVRRSSCHVQVFRPRRTVVRVRMAHVMALIRATEQARCRAVESPWDDLVAQRCEAAGTGNWFFHQKTGNLFNSGLSGSGPATPLSDEELLTCLVCGLDDQYRQAWLQFHTGRRYQLARAV